ncbi:MAG: BACON domain-containing protein [Tannerella sp.]|jgi:hypothetical protein|nr:BACON domain-containing protein [Tannerella sp.]
MKVKYFIKSATVLFLLGMMILPTSCKEDEADPGEPYFRIEGEPTGLNTSSTATNQKYTVRSNRPWKVVSQDAEQKWVRSFPDEGEDDGIFTIQVNANSTVFDRMANFAFVVDGQEQPILFRVEQAAALPSLILTPSPLISVLSGGGPVEIAVNSNVEWNYTLSDASWLSNPTVTKSRIAFTAAPNTTGDMRESVLTVTPVEVQYAALETQVTIRQITQRTDDGQPVGFVYFEDNFDWVLEFTKGEYDHIKIINDWINANYPSGGYPTSGYPAVTAQMNTHNLVYEDHPAGYLYEEIIHAQHGYTDINPDKKTVYFTGHYMKFGVTDGQSGLQRTIPNTDAEKMTNVRMTFDATPCITGTGNYDQVLLLVEITGPGSVGVDDGLTKLSAEIDIRQTNRTFPWAFKPCEVVLYGVTSATQVAFKTNKTGADTGTFRYYLDNLKFEKHSVVTP